MFPWQDCPYDVAAISQVQDSPGYPIEGKVLVVIRPTLDRSTVHFLPSGAPPPWPGTSKPRWLHVGAFDLTWLAPTTDLAPDAHYVIAMDGPEGDRHPRCLARPLWVRPFDVAGNAGPTVRTVVHIQRDLPLAPQPRAEPDPSFVE